VITLKRISLLLVLGACLAATGCGADDEEGAPIPAEQTAALQGRLDETENRLANGSEGACKDILEDTMPEVGNIIDTLPNSVDADVRDALEQSFDNLWALVESECEDLKPDEPTQTQTQPEPETDTTETQTEPTETTPPETDTETTPEEETIPPDGDGESGGEIPETGGNNGGGVGPGAIKLKQQGKEQP
jgi:hypothetical protein